MSHIGARNSAEQTKGTRTKFWLMTETKTLEEIHKASPLQLCWIKGMTALTSTPSVKAPRGAQQLTAKNKLASSLVMNKKFFAAYCKEQISILTCQSWTRSTLCSCIVDLYSFRVRFSKHIHIAAKSWKLDGPWWGDLEFDHKLPLKSKDSNLN